MDYEKRYKALLEQAKEELKTCGSLDCDAAKQIFRFFPELAESEDERIRKAAIAFVKASDHFGYHLGISKENVLSWLEKTSKQESADEPELRFKVGDWVVQKNGDTFYGGAHTVQISKIEDDEIWFTSGTWLTSYYIRHWNIDDAKDGDVLASKDGNDILIFRKLDTTTSLSSYYNLKGRGELGWTRKNFIPATQEQCDLLFQKMKEAGYEWDADKKNIKKQDEPKDYNSIDPHFGKPIETESKFKVGDWIAANRANFRSPIKIVGISNTEYRTEDTKGNSGVSYIDYLDSRFHPWSIADAKDGDILISACNHPFIYNGNSDASLVGGYGGIATACGFKPSAEKCHWTENINIHPATKEEQEYLFQKMAEVGYMWDDYTKSIFCVRSLND